MQLSSQVKKGQGSGSEKLAAHRARNSDPSPDESPKEYHDRVEAEKASSSSSSSNVTIEKASNEYVPSPVSPAYAQEYLKQQQEKKQAVTANPHLLGSDVTARTSITSQPQTNVRQNAGLPATNERTPLDIELSRGIENTIQKGQEQTGNVTVSQWSRNRAQQGADVSEKLNTRATEIEESNDGPVPAVSPYLLRSIAGGVEMVSRAPAGAEIFVQKPSLLPEALTIAALGTAHSVVSDPVQFASDVAVFSVLGEGLAGAGRGIKSRVPAVSAGEQGFLLKFKVAETPSIPDPMVKPTIQAEFKGSTMGIDVFDIQKLNTEVTEFKPTTVGREVLIGESKGGYTDVYFKLNEQQASAISQRYTGNVRNIKTPEGSFVEFEPTGKIDVPIYEKSGSSRIGTPEAELIGNLPDGKTYDLSIRLEKRVNLQKGELSLSDSNRQLLPEFTTTIEGRGKIVNDFDINDFYKTPDVAGPLQLRSGTKMVEQPRTGFLASEEAILRPRKRVTEYKEPTFIGEMSEMQTRFVHAEKPVLKFQESPSKLDMSQMQKLYDEAAKHGNDPLSKSETAKKVSIKRVSQPDREFMPFIAGFPEISPSAQSKTMPEGVTLTEMMAFPDTSTTQDPYPEPYPESAKQKSRNTKPSRPKDDYFEDVPDLFIPRILPSDGENKPRRKRKARKSEFDFELDKSQNLWKNPMDVNFKGL